MTDDAEMQAQSTKTRGRVLRVVHWLGLIGLFYAMPLKLIAGDLVLGTTRSAVLLGLLAAVYSAATTLASVYDQALIALLCLCGLGVTVSLIYVNANHAATCGCERDEDEGRS